VRRAVDDAAKRLGRKRSEVLTPFSRCLIRGNMPAEQALHERHEDEVDRLSRNRSGNIRADRALCVVTLKNGCQCVLPEVDEPTILLQRCFIAAETLHDYQPQELTVFVHELDRTAGHPDEHLVKRKVSGNALEVLQAFKEAAFLDERLEEFALGLEMIVDGGVGYACLFGDVTDGGASEAAPREERERGV